MARDRSRVEILACSGDGFELDGVDGQFTLTPLAHEQVGEYLEVPRKYYEAIRKAHPPLFELTVNTLLRVKQEQRLVRTLDGKMRALLSNRYRPLDHDDLAEAILPRLLQPDLEIKSMELTETRLYIQAVTPRITGEVKLGDEVQAGILISNSEVGLGSLRVEPLVYRLKCLNGMVAGQGMAKYHTGRGQIGDMEGMAQQFYRDETRRLDDAAFFAKTRDLIEGLLSPEGFEGILARLRRAANEMPITGDPVKVVDVTAKRYALADKERGSVLNALISGGDLTAWGLSNAITHLAHEVESYDRAVELERVGGKVIDLNAAEWSSLSRAA
jgi:Domain of unknown function (DUF932)